MNLIAVFFSRHVKRVLKRPDPTRHLKVTVYALCCFCYPARLAEGSNRQPPKKEREEKLVNRRHLQGPPPLPNLVESTFQSTRTTNGVLKNSPKVSLATRTGDMAVRPTKLVNRDL